MSLDRPFMEHTDPLFVHGRGYDGPLKAPVATWHSSLPPRDDHEAPPWLTATEFKGDQEVAAIKVRQLAKLMRLSRKSGVQLCGYFRRCHQPGGRVRSEAGTCIQTSVGLLHLDRFTDTMKIDMKNKCADVFASAFGVAPEKVDIERKKKHTSKKMFTVITATVQPNKGRSSGQDPLPQSAPSS